MTHIHADEPTNHLDLDACVWLEEELRNYKRILVMVSHSQDFLNGVCTNIVHLTKKSLFIYGVSGMFCIGMGKASFVLVRVITMPTCKRDKNWRPIK